MTRELTVKEYAAVERVSERTVWTWIGKGAVPIRRTPGGRVRVLILGSQQLQDLKSQEVQGSLNR